MGEGRPKPGPPTGQIGGRGGVEVVQAEASPDARVERSRRPGLREGPAPWVGAHGFESMSCCGWKAEVREAGMREALSPP